MLTILISCNNTNNDETSDVLLSLDNIQGVWKWESTCGGFIASCAYPSASTYAEIVFTNQNKLIEKHNDQLFTTAKYEIRKTDSFSGILVLKDIESDDIISDSIERPINMVNNVLFIRRGELLDTYLKIK
jgi:hypothetical protein